MSRGKKISKLFKIEASWHCIFIFLKIGCKEESASGSTFQHQQTHENRVDLTLRNDKSIEMMIWHAEMRVELLSLSCLVADNVVKWVEAATTWQFSKLLAWKSGFNNFGTKNFENLSKKFFGKHPIGRIPARFFFWTNVVQLQSDLFFFLQKKISSILALGAWGEGLGY